MMTQTNPPPEGFKTCEVTGEVLPADSMVQFQGKWVGPKGKQILLERLQSGEPTEAATLQRPSFWRRFGCIAFDWLVIIAGYMAQTLVIFIIAALMATTHRAPLLFGGSPGRPAHWLVVGEFVLGVVDDLLIVAYFALLHYKNGQTVGKMVGRLKVVTLDGSPLSLGTAALRAVLYYLPILVLLPVGLYTLIFGYQKVHQVYLPANIKLYGFLCLLVGILSFGWWVADRVTLLVDFRLQRSLHDRLSGTKVIRLPPK